MTTAEPQEDTSTATALRSPEIPFRHFDLIPIEFWRGIE